MGWPRLVAEWAEVSRPLSAAWVIAGICVLAGCETDSSSDRPDRGAALSAAEQRFRSAKDACGSKTVAAWLLELRQHGFENVTSAMSLADWYVSAETSYVADQRRGCLAGLNEPAGNALTVDDVRREQYGTPRRFKGAAQDAWEKGRVDCNQTGVGLDDARSLATNYARAFKPTLKPAALAGCIAGLREGQEGGPVITLEVASELEGQTAQPEPAAPRLGTDELVVYQTEYVVCDGLTVQDIAQEYGYDIRGMTEAEVVLKMARESYGPEYQQLAYEACLAAIRGEPSRYP